MALRCHTTDAALLDVVLAEEGYEEHPMETGVAGYAWTAAERRGFGEYAYAAVRETQERERGLVRLRALRVGGAPGYARLGREEDGTWGLRAMRSPAELRLALADVGFLMRRAPGKPLVRMPFADAWMRDPGARTLEAAVYAPDRAPGLSQDARGWWWNAWPGLAAARLEAADEWARTVGVAAIEAHVREVLCDGDAAHAAWLLDYMAVVVQRPWAKTGVAVVVSGPQGAGKNAVLDFFREKVLGPRVTAALQDPKRQGLFGHFAAAHAGKVLVQIDEAEGLAGVDAALKHLVTGTTAPVHRKYQDHDLDAPNFVNLVMTTNGACPVKLPPAERRFCVFRASGRRVGDAAYFVRLHATLKRAGVARAFYDALCARDVSRFGSDGDLQTGRPLTAYYRACAQRAIDPLRRFLAACAHAGAYASPYCERAPAVRAGLLYADYLAFFADTGAARVGADEGSGERRKPLSLVGLGAALVTLGPEAGVTRQVWRGQTVVYLLDYAALRRALGPAEWADDAQLMRPPHPSAWAMMVAPAKRARSDESE